MVVVCVWDETTIKKFNCPSECVVRVILCVVRVHGCVVSACVSYSEWCVCNSVCW